MMFTQRDVDRRGHLYADHQLPGILWSEPWYPGPWHFVEWRDNPRVETLCGVVPERPVWWPADVTWVTRWKSQKVARPSWRCGECEALMEARVYRRWV